MLGESSVKMELDGKDVELTATVEAAVIISTAFSGVKEAYDRVLKLDLVAITTVVRAGLMIDGPEAEQLMDKVYKTGLIKIQPRVTEFLLMMLNGGIAPKLDDEGTDEEVDESSEKKN